ncbi:MAG: class I SAM-dependent methyltransferase [Acidobacteriia bacterium]|nr:class I SAM-dependent methyltransferase [Terriglobia bacterium]
MASALSATRYATPLGDKSSRNYAFVELASQGRRILEFGCANGFISRHLTERGCQVTGVEVDATAAAEARQWCEKIVVADLNKQEWIDQVGDDFDTVLFGDVLEHLLHPEETLRNAARVLAPRGQVIISLPNIAHWSVRSALLRGRFEYQSTGILDITHLRFFTPASARRFIEDAGYQIDSTLFFVSGSGLGRRMRLLFPGLFATQMMFVATPSGAPPDNSQAPHAND